MQVRNQIQDLAIGSIRQGLCIGLKTNAHKASDTRARKNILRKDLNRELEE